MLSEMLPGQKNFARNENASRTGIREPNTLVRNIHDIDEAIRIPPEIVGEVRRNLHSPVRDEGSFRLLCDRRLRAGLGHCPQRCHGCLANGAARKSSIMVRRG